MDCQQSTNVEWCPDETTNSYFFDRLIPTENSSNEERDGDDDERFATKRTLPKLESISKRYWKAKLEAIERVSEAPLMVANEEEQSKRSGDAEPNDDVELRSAKMEEEVDDGLQRCATTANSVLKDDNCWPIADRRLRRSIESSPTIADAAPRFEDDFKPWNCGALLEALYNLNNYANGTKSAYLQHLRIGCELKESNIEDEDWMNSFFVLSNGILSWSHGCSDKHLPDGQMNLIGADVAYNSEERLLRIVSVVDTTFMVIKLPNVQDAITWPSMVQWHTRENLLIPSQASLRRTSKKILILEIGACSTRVGLVQNELTLPLLFFPSIMASDGSSFGKETAVLLSQGDLHRSRVVDYGHEAFTYSRDSLHNLKLLLTAIARRLNINVELHQILLSLPVSSTSVAKIGDLFRMLLFDMRFAGVAVDRQPNLSMIAFDSKTGLVVDISRRLNIVAILDGYVVTGASISVPHFGAKMDRLLRRSCTLDQVGLQFDSSSEHLLLRYIKERACHVSQRFTVDQVQPTEISLKDIDEHRSLTVE